MFLSDYGLKNYMLHCSQNLNEHKIQILANTVKDNFWGISLVTLRHFSCHSHPMIKQTNDNCSYLKARRYSNYVGTTILYVICMNMHNEMLHMCSNFINGLLLKLAKYSLEHLKICPVAMKMIFILYSNFLISEQF